ncbi:hypothetical protein RS9916_39066 [Synechococcus sp. RS9916]|nr:hypothetical protein RS9916_39066 [Synechococcus sp. RS9916]
MGIPALLVALAADVWTFVLLFAPSIALTGSP